MATGKRYFWIKLKDSFMTSDTVDYFMGQPNGANYVVLYQMLLLKTINTDGRLERRIGEVIIPYDVEKIQRDCKWFSADTIRVALNLYRACGLIYEDEDGVLTMAGHNEMVGSETDYALQKRNQRKTDLLINGPVEYGVDIVHTENREKRIENREQSIENILIPSNEGICRTDVQRVADEWNALGLGQVTKITGGSNRGKMLKARIREYGLEEVIKAIQGIKDSDFLTGKSTDFVITFDWFVRPNNFIKVYEGNYTNKPKEEDFWHKQY